MTQTATLSGDEIEALIGGITADTDGGSATEPRSFSFGGDVARPMSVLPALDRLSERMVRRLRDLLEGFMRIQPQVTGEPTAIQSFASWKAGQKEFTSLSLFAFTPLKGSILITLPPALIGRLVDAYYGGAGLPPAKTVREFTPTEESLIARLTDRIVATLVLVWKEIAPVQPQLRGRETNIAFANLACRDDEAVAVCRYMVGIGGGEALPIDIVYPVAALRSVEASLAAKCNEELAAKSGEWRRKLAATVGEVRVKARTVLARPELSVSELMQLKAGDVIPVSLSSLVPLLVEGRPVALGSIGEHDGRAALKIEKIQGRRFA